MYTRIHTCIYIHVYTYTYIHTRIYIHVCIIYIYTHTYINSHASELVTTQTQAPHGHKHPSHNNIYKAPSIQPARHCPSASFAGGRSLCQDSCLRSCRLCVATQRICNRIVHQTPKCERDSFLCGSVRACVHEVLIYVCACLNFI